MKDRTDNKAHFLKKNKSLKINKSQVLILIRNVFTKRDQNQ